MNIISKKSNRQNNRKIKNSRNTRGNSGYNQPQKQVRVEAPYPHFRKYLKSGHPALIVGERLNANSQEEYQYRKVMHGDKDGRHNNDPVIPNPKPGDTEPMYIAKRKRYDLKKFFSLKPYKWKNIPNCNDR